MCGNVLKFHRPSENRFMNRFTFWFPQLPEKFCLKFFLSICPLWTNRQKIWTNGQKMDKWTKKLGESPGESPEESPVVSGRPRARRSLVAGIMSPASFRCLRHRLRHQELMPETHYKFYVSLYAACLRRLSPATHYKNSRTFVRTTMGQSIALLHTAA